MRSRGFTTLALSSLLLAAACSSPESRPSGTATSSPSDGESSSGNPGGPIAKGPSVDVACGLPRSWLVRIWNGHVPSRSGEIQILPKVPHILGAGLPHAGPWGFLEDVPLFWYGPGHIAPVGTIARPVTVADLAPTWARLLGFDFNAPDGTPMDEALPPEEERGDPPRLIVLLVWDGAGRNVLGASPDSWPNLKGLIPQGAWFDKATVGSSPTSTAQIHSSMGTGAFPRTHGIVGHHFRVGDRIISPWKPGSSINLLRVPALADLYDVANGNRPKMALSASVAIHLGMIGHGAAWEDGDRDLVALRELAQSAAVGAEGVRWNLPEHLHPYFRFPSYANDFPPLSDYFDEVDRLDGTRDDTWRGTRFTDERLEGGFDSPARVPYQTRLLEEMIEREGLGADEVPDMLFVNYKLIDEIGHIFTLNSEEMSDTLLQQDRYLGTFIDFLNDRVGEGEWVLTVTADHGSVPNPELTGAFQIGQGKVHAAIQSAFDKDDDDIPVVSVVKQTEIFANEEELAQHGFTLDDVAQLVMGLTRGDTFIPGVSEPGENPDEKVFRAAFPSEIIERLPCLPEARQERA